MQNSANKFVSDMVSSTANENNGDSQIVSPPHNHLEDSPGQYIHNYE